MGELLQTRWSDGDERRHEPPRQRDTNAAAEGGQEQALGQQQPHDPSAGRAEDGSQRDLLPSRGRSGELQVGDIDAGDQQHEPDCAEQHEQRRAQMTEQVVTERAQQQVLALAADFRMGMASRKGTFWPREKGPPFLSCAIAVAPPVSRGTPG